MSTATLETGPIAESMAIPAPMAVSTPIPTPIPVPTTGLVTPEDLLAMPDSVSYELVDGHLVERNVSRLPSLVALEIGTQIRDHVKLRKLGWVFGTDLGYRCFPDRPGRIRKPDGSFVRLDRMPAESLGEAYSNIALDVERKLGEYRGVGVPLVWIVYPAVRAARVHRLDGTTAYLLAEDHLDGGDVLPGLRIRLGDLLPEQAVVALPEAAVPSPA